MVEENQKTEILHIPVWLDYLVISGYTVMGITLMRSPEALTATWWAKYMYGAFLILSALIWYTRLVRENIMKQNLEVDYVNSLPKAKGKFEN
jgi:hypothetical protein